jgi:hypothetical protein
MQPEKSYAHPNGFIKIVLFSQPRFQLRLHLWRIPEVNANGSTGNAHNHRWNFAAAVLAGAYRYREYREDNGGERFHSYSYEASRGAGSYALVPTGMRRLSCVFDAHLPAGSVYTLAADVVHRVSCETRHRTVSLVLQGPRARSTVEVYAMSALASGASLPLHALSPEFLAREMAGLLQDTRHTGTGTAKGSASRNRRHN